ncbi:MAG TPA: cytochrome c oxidase subunit II [Polyangiaceae bacterium]|jgi:cytochrome c oxidase subunit 2
MINLLGLVPPAAFDLPPAISAEAPDVDWLYNMIYYVSVFFTVVITALMLYWVRKYRRRPGDKRMETPHYPRLEIAWTVIPIFFVVFLFHWGFKAYMRQAIAAPDALEIRVRGQKWFWTFTYPNGREENNNLYLPVGKQVKFVISSADVLHSFYIPGARTKKDAVPGMYTVMVVTPNQLGDTPVFCAEYCGAPLGYPEPALEGAPHGGHSAMMAMIHVVPQDEFDKFIKEGPKRPEGLNDAQWGQKLYRENACITCHSVDGSKGTGPSWKGLWGSTVELNSALSGGVGSVTFDEKYVHESVLKPTAKVVSGFNPVMPPYNLSDKQIDAIIAYMKTLK